MELTIIQTPLHEAEKLLTIQKEAFYEDLLKYEDAYNLKNWGDDYVQSIKTW